MAGLQSSDSLSPWEREQITGNHTIVGFQSSDSPSPWEREQIVGNQNNGRTSVICSLSPWERARERAKPFWNAVIPIFKKHPFKTDTDKRDGRT